MKLLSIKSAIYILDIKRIKNHLVKILRGEGISSKDIDISDMSRSFIVLQYLVRDINPKGRLEWNQKIMDRVESYIYKINEKRAKKVTYPYINYITYGVDGIGYGMYTLELYLDK